MKNIHFDSFNVKTIRKNSGIFNGENFHHNFLGSSESNEGFGEIIGDYNRTSRTEHQVFEDRRRSSQENIK